MIERIDRDYGAEWIVPSTLRQLVAANALDDVSLGTFGCDDSERATLMDAADIVRIVAEIDGEPDDRGNFREEPTYRIEVYEARPMATGRFDADWHTLAVAYDTFEYANAEASLRQNNQNRIAAERARSAALAPLFLQLAGTDTISDMDRVGDEVVKMNAEWAADAADEAE